jgi:hypothetical protein
MNRYIAIRSEGGLIPFDTIEKLLRGELPGQKPADFGLERGGNLGDETARAWSDVLDYWHIFRRRMEALPENDPGTTLTRERWVVPLLTDLLGYELTYQSAGGQVGGKSYPVSHRAGAGDEAPRVHIVGFRQDLDRRDEAGHRRMSPQALVQEYVNRSEHLWGVVTNGLRFRLLRDTTRTARPTYLEFDLQNILEGSRFNEFVIFYRLCHRTRLPKTVDDAKDCLLEQYYQTSIDEGLRVRDRLRDGVEDALKQIGTGLLQHPANDALRNRARSGGLTSEVYYRQLLGLIYRLLFLMVAEERQMIILPGPDAERREQIYDRLYSLRRIRDLAEQPIEESPYSDLWAGLQETFQLFANGRENPLGMPPLNGQLFGPDGIPDLEETILCNHDFLLAIRRLSVFKAGGAPTRVNYAGLDVEELGSVYESLLAFHPVFEREDGTFKFDLKTGTERKSTGSYYTPRELVSELIESALVPVLEDRLAKARTWEEKEQAILTMSVCDPACGSGHFLLSAARRIARELARVRSGEDEPTPDEFRHALRDVIQHCVHGVDKNQLAVDLCKVAMWIEGHNHGLPLSFLDHRIKCGDSLVGIFSLEKLAEGIPDEAYSPIFGDDKETAKALRRRNAKEHKSRGRQLPLVEQDLQEHVRKHASAYSALAALPQGTVTHVQEMDRRYREIHGEGSSWWRDWVAANMWTAAFFLPLAERSAAQVPTTDHLRDWLAGVALPDGMVKTANKLGVDSRFFHWTLEYPEVFARGGFDVVLGNPPWERIKLQEEEFFAIRDSLIAEASTKDAREKLIARLPTNNPHLYEEYVQARHRADAQSTFVRASRRFPFTAVGDINTYALFAELARRLLAEHGCAGLVIPDTIATNATTAAFFNDLVVSRSLASLYGFKNERFIFPGVEHTVTFALLTIGGKNVSFDAMEFCWLAWTIEEMREAQRRIALTAQDLRLVNPNTGTCPIFRTQADAELTLGIYRRLAIIANAHMKSNPWELRQMTMFHMANDSSLFLERKEQGLVPLYEAKMIHQYDHRFGTYEGASGQRKGAELPSPKEAQYCDPEFSVKPRYWVRADNVERRLDGWSRGWLLGFREIARATDERTAIFSILPQVAIGHKITLLLPGIADARFIACFLAQCNSILFDYVVRQKVGGTSLSWFIFEQLPTLAPSDFAPEDMRFIVPRVLELVFAALDVRSFAQDLGYDHAPFPWDRERRHLLRSELDAYIANLYGFTREQLSYVLDPRDVYGQNFHGETFRVLREREEREFGEYRTRRLVLEAYDELARTSRFGGRVSAAITKNPLKKDA